MNTRYYDFFHKVQKDYRHYCVSLLNEYHFTSYEVDVLTFLVNNPTLDQAKDIVYIKGISKGLVAKAVKSLYDKGYIDIRMDDKDHRCMHLLLSDKCEDIKKIITNSTKKFTMCLQDGITSDDVMLINSIFMKMNKNLDEFERRYK